MTIRRIDCSIDLVEDGEPFVLLLVSRWPSGHQLYFNVINYHWGDVNRHS